MLINAILSWSPSVAEVLRELVPDVPVLSDIEDVETVRGQTLLGSVPPRISHVLQYLIEPVIPVTLEERSGELTVDQVRERLKRFSIFEIENLGEPTEPAELIATRHPGLIDHLRKEGLVEPGAPDDPHAQAEDVRDRHVAGIMPARIAAAARCVTYVPANVPPGVEPPNAEAMAPYITGPAFVYEAHELGTVSRRGLVRLFR